MGVILRRATHIHIVGTVCGHGTYIYTLDTGTKYILKSIIFKVQTKPPHDPVLSNAYVRADLVARCWWSASVFQEKEVILVP